MTNILPPPKADEAVPDQSAKVAKKKSSWNRRIVAFLAWTYLVIVLVALAGLRFAGDRWWLATLLTFGPRWLVLVPLPTLIPLAVFFHRRALAPVLLAGLLGAGPIMGFCIPWRGLVNASPVNGGPLFRIITYNCGEGGADPQRLGEFVRASRPDLLILNEWLPGKGPIPVELGDDWQVEQNGGIVLLSRFPIISVQKLGAEGLRKPWRAPAMRCELETPRGKVDVVAVHLDTPRKGLQKVLGSRWEGAPALRLAIQDRIQESNLSSQFAAESRNPVLVAGDFNMPVDSAIYRQFWSPWQNAFSTAGWGFGHTKFTERFGIRIDHVLASDGWRILKAQVGPDLGGDHRPVVVELQLK